MIKSIERRDGRIVLYNSEKIANAILKALEAAQCGDAQEAAKIAQRSPVYPSASFPER